MRHAHIIIKYELDDPTATAESEYAAWLNGEVGIADVITTGGRVTLRVLFGHKTIDRAGDKFLKVKP